MTSFLVFHCPQTQTIHNKIAHNRMIAVHNISASAEIIVMSVRSQHIVNIIVNSLETKTRAHLVAFCSVIKYNIKNDLDSIFLQLARCLVLIRASVFVPPTSPLPNLLLRWISLAISVAEKAALSANRQDGWKFWVAVW